MTAVLADKPPGPLHHQSEVMTQKAVWTVLYLFIHHTTPLDILRAFKRFVIPAQRRHHRGGAVARGRAWDRAAEVQASKICRDHFGGVACYSLYGADRIQIRAPLGRFAVGGHRERQLRRASRGLPKPAQALQLIPVHRLAKRLATGPGPRRESAHHGWRDSSEQNLGRSKAAPNTH
jgi:hypothetical protein